MKVIAFSLWGSDPKYNVGAVRNAEIAASMFPEWQCRFYVPRFAGSPPAVVQLSQLDNVDLVVETADGNWTGMFWRFQAACDDKVEAMISRDCDSRLSQREKAAVDEWLMSDKKFHCMRDHVWHNRPVLGGMWGAKRGFLSDFAQLLDDAKKEDRWQTDQDFLNDVVWPRLDQDEVMQHDNYYRHLWGGKPFPTPREGGAFVGEIIDANEQPNIEHRRMSR